MPKRKPYGNRAGPHQHPCLQDLISSDHKSKASSDLFVLTPKEPSKLENQLIIKDIMNRLASTGFGQMALTHKIYGRPDPIDDQVENALPRNLWHLESRNKDDMGENNRDKNIEEPVSKKRKTSGKHNGPPILVLRRLHAVVENLSDVGGYLSNGPHKLQLSEYDLVSLSPRNEAVFQSACSSATAADIITLDYNAGRGGLRLPYKIRPTDVKAVIEREAAFEIPFAPALLHGKQRKALIQTCRELQMASLGMKPIILFSSGDRTLEDSDVGAMALRTPGDLSNVLQTVLRFDATTSQNALRSSAIKVLNRTKHQKLEKSAVVDVFHIHETGPSSISSKAQVTGPKHSTVTQQLASTIDDSKAENTEQASSSDVEDGFITIN